MAASKIELRLGDIHFSGEGTESWVTKQLDKVLSQLPSANSAAKSFVEAESDEPDAPVKKRRGRPAKAKAAKAAKSPTGKKRGRPAKAKAAASPTGKRRGRPRKEAGDTGDATGAANNATIDPAMIAEVVAFLTEKQALDNQNRKFLATAAWLTQHGITKLRTRDVTRTLDAAGQGKLSNPSMNLIQNVDKGFCKRSGKFFTVTDDGVASLTEASAPEPEPTVTAETQN